MLLQIDPVISSVLEYGALGVLIALLIFAVIFLAKRLQSEQDYSKSLSEKVVALMTKVESTIDEDSELKQILLKDFPDMKRDVAEIRELLKK